MPFPVKLGAIDAGSNAIRVVVATALGVSELQRVEAERVSVRLGHGAFTRGELDAATIDAAVEAFRGFRSLFDRHGVTAYRAVATSALRDVHNGDVLLHRVYHEAGIELEVIDGAEEARLVRRAVGQAFAGREPPRVIIDLGGGSLEVNLRQGARWHVGSLPIGTVRAMESLELTGAIGEREASVIRRNVAALLRTVMPKVEGDPGPAAACGGNAESLADLFGKPRDGMPSLKPKYLEKALPALLAADVEQRMAAYSVRRDRAEVMGVAALVFAETCKELGISRLMMPNVGIREALLLETAEQLDKGLHDDKARRHSLLAAARIFANRVGHETTHAEHVRRLAHSLFGQLASLHGLRKELGAVLEVAALLHDVGVVVHGRSHHKHGEYLVRHGRIAGLGDSDREMVAALVRSHRKASPDTSKHEAYATLSPKHRAEVRKLAALLRLADGLDRDHRQSVSRLEAHVDGKVVTLQLDVRAGGRLPEPPRSRKRSMFELELGCELRTEYRESPA